MDFQQNESSKSKELFLDTKSTCFLCLKEIDTDLDSFPGIKMSSEVCLRKICKYLNINPSSILLESLKGGKLNKTEMEEASSQRNNCDFSGILCFKCNILSSKLSELISQLEITKMLIKHKVTEFHQTLSKSTSIRWKMFQDKMVSKCSNPVEARLVENLRKDTRKNCAVKVKQLKAASLPKVQIKKMKTEKQTPPIIRDNLSSSLNVEKENKASMEDDNYYGNQSDEYQEEEEILDPEFYKNHLKLPRYGKKGCLYCHYCHSEASKVNMHLLNNHPEKLFLSYKLHRLSEIAFRDCCKGLLTLETKKAVQEGIRTGLNPVLKSNKDRRSLIVCWICKKKYSSGKDFRYHLVSKHFSRIRKRLMEMQTRTSLESAQRVETAEMMDDEENSVQIQLENAEEDFEANELSSQSHEMVVNKREDLEEANVTVVKMLVEEEEVTKELAITGNNFVKNEFISDIADISQTESILPDF